MKIERRAIKGLTFRAAESGTNYIGVLTGYAAKYNSDSVRFSGWEKDWIERIAPGAFKRTLAENPDVVALWSHDASKPAARTPDTLTVREDDTGLAVEIRLVDTATNRDLLTNVRAGIVDSMSFGFIPVKTRWTEQKDADHDVRTLEDVDLLEVSPVVWPAYPETTIGARSHRAFRELRATAPDLREVMEEREKFLSDAKPAPAAITPQRDIWAARLGNL
jgi:HK97 family phage prohead protease